MTKFGPPQFPPMSNWDERLVGDVCPNLDPPKVMHENPWFKVNDRGDYFTTEYKSRHVILLPVVENHSVILIRARRPVLNDCPFELPAGNIEENESPEEACRRELAQETGLKIESLDRFKPCFPMAVSPNRDPRLVYVYEIHLTAEEADSKHYNSDHEIESVHCYSFQKLKEMILNGEIYVSTPLAMVSLHLLKNSELLTR